MSKETKLIDLLILLHNKDLEKTIKVRINGKLFEIVGVANSTKNGLTIDAE
jgi:hypothetical protein